ncbi:hypothetical protein D3C72_1591920 [compost metagenome]
MADVHAGFIQTLHPRRRDRGLAFREAANQGNLQLIVGHATERRLNLAFQLRVLGHTRLLALLHYGCQFIEQLHHLRLLVLELFQSMVHCSPPWDNICFEVNVSLSLE